MKQADDIQTHFYDFSFEKQGRQVFLHNDQNDEVFVNLYIWSKRESFVYS